MFKTIKRLLHHYRLIHHTTAEIFRLEDIIENCHNKQILHETYIKLIGVRGFFREITGKTWKSQKPYLRADNFNIIKTARK